MSGNRWAIDKRLRTSWQGLKMPYTCGGELTAAWGDKEMRLKQLLGTILLATAASAGATAFVAQLSGVVVKNQDSAGVVTILASGAFTHTEYRPTDNLM